jgi:hypothetical protein
MPPGGGFDGVTVHTAVCRSGGCGDIVGSGFMVVVGNG